MPIPHLVDLLHLDLGPWSPNLNIPAGRGGRGATSLPPEELESWRKRSRSRHRPEAQVPRLFLLLVAGALVIWLAFLLSAALTAVGSDLNVFAATDADAATTLNCGVNSCGTGTLLDYSFTPTAGSWNVVASRSTAGTGNPDLCLYGDAAYSQLRACSDASLVNGFVEFVAVDYHRAAAATAYPRMQRSGSGEVCTQLDCGTLLAANGTYSMLTWNTGNIVRVFNVPVTAGQTYRADVIVSAGSADFGLAVMQANGANGYAAGRGSATVSADRRGAGQGEGLYFDAAQSDTIGLVVWVNNAATSANYRIAVRPATRLLPNNPTTFGGTNMKDFFTVPSNPRGWSVIGLRPTAVSDADLRQFNAPDNVTLVGTANATVGIVDYIVTDFAHTTEDTSTVLMISTGPTGSYVMDWHEQPQSLGPAADVALDLGGRVGTGFTADLTAGLQYKFSFDPEDGSTGDACLSLFGPRAAFPNFTYGVRADSIQGSDVWAGKVAGWSAGEGIESFTFTPTISGEYFLYAYEKTSAAVIGHLQFYPTALVGAPPGPPAGTRVALASPWPSPARGQTVRLRCDLAEAARADLDIVDVRGRSVQKAYGGILPAGASVLTWDGRAQNGLPAPPGLYYARLSTPLGNVTQVIVWLR